MDETALGVASTLAYLDGDAGIQHWKSLSYKRRLSAGVQSDDFRAASKPLAKFWKPYIMRDSTQKA
jgi:hypothetical protein